MVRYNYLISVFWWSASIYKKNPESNSFPGFIQILLLFHSFFLYAGTFSASLAKEIQF
jgi:hypothetical protein